MRESVLIYSNYTMSSLRIIPAAIASCFSLVTLSYFFFVSLPFHIEQYRLSKRIAHHREQKAREEELAAKECVSGYPVIQGLETLAPQDVSDVALPVSENRDGIVFHETTAVTSTETSKMAPLLESVQDRADTMDIFKIPVRVASGVWTTSQTPNTVLYEINYNTAHLSCNRWAEIFNKYTFYRYRVRVRVELDGTPFHQGKLLLYYHPGFTVPTGVFASLDNITSLEHRSIYPAYNNVQELKMPWQYHFDYARVNPTSTFSSFLRLAVFNQLQAGTGAVTSLNWSVYLTLEDVELKVPVPITLPAALLGVEPFEEIKPFAYDSTPIPVVQGLLNFTTINNQFSNITDSTLPTNVTGDKFDTEVSASGMMDNPNWTANAPAAKVRVLDSMSNTKGPVVNYRMALDPSKMMDPGPELFDCTNDEMDLTDLTSRWSLVNSQSRGITFGATDQAGKVLFQTYLNPGVLGGAVDNSAAPAPVYRNLLCYLAQRFQRWHGGIKFCVEIIATQYQTGKLFLGFSPGYVDVVSNTPGGADILTNYGKVIEVNKGRNLYEIEIPWYYLTEWASTVYTLSQTNSITYDLYGKFYVAVVNPLAVPAGTPSTIAFNVYVAGAEDFRFSFPVGTTTSAQIQGANTIGRFGGRTKGVDNIHDIPRSLRDIVRRPQYYTGFDLTFLENAPVKYAIVPLDWIMAGYYDETLLNNTRRSGTLGYFGALYRGYTGDLRIKALVTRTTTGTSVDQNLPASNKYPLHVAHFPTLPQKNNTTPTNNEVVRGIQLWLKARYLQSSAGTILKTPPNDIATAAWGTTGISAPGYANAPAMFEETIIDPIQSLELEIPMNGLAKFSTNDASSGALARGEDAHSKSWGYLVFHQWANHTAGTADTTDFTWVDMYLGAADNFRMGMHIGIPNIVSYNAAAANPFGRFTN